MVDDGRSADPLENLLAILWSRKLLFATGFLVILVITVLGAISMPLTYEAYTSIFVSSPPVISRIGLPLSEEVIGRSFLANQVTIIQSRVILERVVHRLNLHRIPREKSFVSRTKDQVYGVLNITRPRPDPLEEAIAGLRRTVSVRLPRGTNIVVIAAKARSADFSAVQANTVADVYVEYANELFAASTQSGYGFLEDRFLEAEGRLAAAQSELDLFKKREMSFLMPAEGTVIAQRLGQLQEEDAQIHAQLEYLRRERARVLGDLGGMLSSVRERTPEVLALEEERQRLKEELSSTLVYLKEDHPDVRAMRHRISQVEGRIGEASGRMRPVDESGRSVALAEEIQALEGRRRVLSGQISKILAQRQELLEKQGELEVLVRDVERHRQRVEALRSAVEQARAIRSPDLIQESIRIVDRAFPPPHASRRTQTILLAVGAVFGVIFGIGMAFVAEYFDDSLKTADEVEAYLDIPVLGSIPAVKRRA